MPRPFEEGIPAEYRYQRVHYHPFGNEPADATLLSADPWAFLSAWLSQNCPKRGRTRAQYERALYYAQLAEGFYRAAHSVALPTEGTLAYYGMLNLTKCFLSVRGVELESQFEHHGLSLAQGRKSTVQVAANTTNGLNIFHEFAREMSTPVQGKRAFDLQTICANIPEIHEIAFGLEQLPWPKRKFLPITVDFLVNQAKTHLFTEIRYAKKSEARVQIERFNKDVRKQYFVKRVADNNGTIYRSQNRKALNNANWPRIYKNVCGEYRNFQIVTLLSRSGYLYYCDLRPGPYHHLCMSFLLMYYIGTVARYRPTEMNDVLRSVAQPLLTEALAITPRQFLYQLVSYITKRVCVIPYACI